MRRPRGHTLQPPRCSSRCPRDLARSNPSSPKVGRALRPCARPSASDGRGPCGSAWLRGGAARRPARGGDAGAGRSAGRDCDIDGARTVLFGAALLGAGTAMVYPALLAVIGDVAHPAWRLGGRRLSSVARPRLRDRCRASGSHRRPPRDPGGALGRRRADSGVGDRRPGPDV
jgi:hypothetical protein